MRPIRVAVIAVVIGLAGYAAISALKQESSSAAEAMQLPDTGIAPGEAPQVEIVKSPRVSTQLHELPASNAEGYSRLQPPDLSSKSN